MKYPEPADHQSCLNYVSPLDFGRFPGGGKVRSRRWLFLGTSQYFEKVLAASFSMTCLIMGRSVSTLLYTALVPAGSPVIIQDALALQDSNLDNAVSVRKHPHVPIP